MIELKLLLSKLTSFTGSNPFGIIATDITGKQASGEGFWSVGICEGLVQGVRVPYGDRDLRASGGSGMVPFCLGVPDEAAIQPGILPRPPNLSHFGWRKEAKLRRV